MFAREQSLCSFKRVLSLKRLTNDFTQNEGKVCYKLLELSCRKNCSKTHWKRVVFKIQSAISALASFI